MWSMRRVLWLPLWALAGLVIACVEHREARVVGQVLTPTDAVVADAAGEAALVDTPITDASKEESEPENVVDASLDVRPGMSILARDAGTALKIAGKKCPRNPKEMVGAECSEWAGPGVCDDKDVSCGCFHNQCFTPAGPVRNCVPSSQWRCLPRTKDACPPIVREGAGCTGTGMCTSTEGMCARFYRCSAGRLRFAKNGSCAPATRPMPSQ